MCFSSPKMPEASPAPGPTPLPSPAPTPVAIEAVKATEETKRKRLAAMRYGMMSTIKTAPKGTLGNPQVNVASAGGKEKLGQ